MDGRVYEMLWDCEFCGTQKLLGKTHRRCLKCGAPQDPKRRYFPSEADKVAADAHVSRGADRICSGCNVASPHEAAFCVGCGAPLASAPEVQRRRDVEAANLDGRGETVADAVRDFQLQAASRVAEPSPDPGAWRQAARAGAGYALGRWLRTSRLARPMLALLVLGAVLGVVVLWWKEDVRLSVAHLDWTRQVHIERFGSVRDSDWCSSMPGGAYDVSISRRERSTREVPDGQDCSTSNVDQGDGTYRQERHCTTKYRSEPVYDRYCDYTLNRWAHVNDVTKSGEGGGSQPVWPVVTLARPGDCLGCERVGGRSETYSALLRRAASNDVVTCAFDQGTWATLKVGSELSAKARVLTGGIDCSSLRSGDQALARANP